MRLPLTLEQHKAIKSAAVASGMDATAWVREQIDKGLRTAPSKPPSVDDLLRRAQEGIEEARARLPKKLR